MLSKEEVPETDLDNYCNSNQALYIFGQGEYILTCKWVLTVY